MLTCRYPFLHGVVLGISLVHRFKVLIATVRVTGKSFVRHLFDGIKVARFTPGSFSLMSHHHDGDKSLTKASNTNQLRTKLCILVHARLKDFKIETATTGSQNGLLVDPKLCHFVVGTQGRAATVRYPCPRPIMARFVKVSLTALERLQLCEVAVIGTETRKFLIVNACVTSM